MKLKKLVAFALCMSMIIPFAGCGRKLPAGSTGSTKEASSANTGGDIKPEPGATLKYRVGADSDFDFAKAVADNFKKKYGVTVDVENGNLGDVQKIQMEAQSKTGPDICMCANDKSGPLIKDGSFLAVDDSIVNTLKSEISPLAMKTVTNNGKVYGVPVSIETYVMFYNKKLVKKPVTTFKELSEEAKKFNDTSKNNYAFLFDSSTGSPIYTMISTYGWRLFGQNGTDDKNPGFDKPEFEKGLEVLRAYHNIVPVKSTDLGTTDFLKSKFTSGNCEYLLDGPWDIKLFKDAKVDFGAVGLPTYDGHQESTFGFVQNAHIASYTKYPKAAQLFVQYLVNDESSQLLYSKDNKITARKDVSKIKGLSNDQVCKAIIDQFNKSTLAPNSSRTDYFWTICNQVGPAVFDGSMSPKEGAKKAMDEWKDDLTTEK